MSSSSPPTARQGGGGAAAAKASLKSLLTTLQKERLIGNGADGKVFLMRDPAGAPYAVKEMILSDHQLTRAEGVKRQIELLQQMPEHPTVIRHYGAHLGTCSLHIVMEFVPGGSIATLLGVLGAFHESAVRRYARELCEGLAFLHDPKQDVVHRDVKGANCLVNSDGRLQIADFGSSVIGASSSGGEQAAARGLQGTAHWMSPESIREEVSDKGDIWALGCTVIEMATGRSPWADARFTNDWAAMFHISQCGRGPPIPPHLSRQAHAFLRACFDVNPATRPDAKACLAMPFLSEDFDEQGGPEMQPPDEEEMTPFGEGMPHRDDSPLGTDYASTFSSVSFAPIEPEWGDAEQPELADSDAQPTLGASSDTTAAGGGASSRPSSSEAHHHTSADGPPRGPGSRKHRMSVTTPSVQVKATVTPADILASVRAAAASSPSGAQPPSSTAATSAAPSLVPLPMAPHRRSLARLEEAELFNILTFLNDAGLGRIAPASRDLHALIDGDARERLWRRLFVAVFGPVDGVRAALRKSWKLAFRSSKLAAQWSASGGRYRVVRRLAHSANVFEAKDMQGGAVGSHEAVPCMMKVEALPRPKTRAASTPVKRRDPTPHHFQSPARVGTAGRLSGLPPASPNRVPAHLPTMSNPPPVPSAAAVAAATAAAIYDDPKSRLPPTQGGRFTFIRPPHPAVGSGGAPGGGGSGGAPGGIPPLASVPGPPGSRQQPRHHHHHHEPPTLNAAQLDSPLSGVTRAATEAAPATGSGVAALGTITTTASSTFAPGSLAAPRTAGDTWHELYEYQRTADPAAAAPAPKPTKSSAQHQYRILRHLDAMGVQCIPRPLYLNTDGSDVNGHSVLVTSALGPSLSELLLFSGNQLSTRTVMTLALKLLMALADMHDRDVVHGGLTPSNVVMGRGPDRDKVYFINFSHARFYRDPKTHRAATNVVGGAAGAKRSHEYYCFCSTSVQRGCTPCPRDDIISVGYVLCYLTHGGLPWSGDGTEQLDGSKVVKAKNQYMEALATTPPLQLFAFLKSAYALRQGDTPDYVYLCNLVRRMMRERGWSPDAPLDWDKRANL